MNKNTKLLAMLILPLLLGIASMLTGKSLADGHYRLGTINESHHYRNNDEFNSSHNGFYIVHRQHVFGTYENSEYEQSIFYARNKRLTKSLSFMYGVASGYDVGLMPMVGLSAQFSVVKLTLTQEAAVVGLEFPVF